MFFLSRRSFFVFLGLLALAVLIGLGSLFFDWGTKPQENTRANFVHLRILTHSSFDLDKKLLSEFEAKEGVKLDIITAGDAGEVLNKLILTRQAPIADVVYGLDNLSVSKAVNEGVLEPYVSTAVTHYSIGTSLSAIDYGAVTLNADKAALQKRGLAQPTKLEDFLKPAYRGTLVVQNPATSSPGQAFLVATILYFGEEKAWEFWRGLKQNGLKVSSGWSEAYQKEFSQNGGRYPFVVSYASSPAAEVFYGEGKYQEPPTLSLSIPGGAFLQVEGAGLVHKDKSKSKSESESESAQVEVQSKAKVFIDFMQSASVQNDLQTRMWMLPAVKGVTPHVALSGVQMPAGIVYYDKLEAEKVQTWVKTWTRLMR